MTNISRKRRKTIVFTQILIYQILCGNTENFTHLIFIRLIFVITQKMEMITKYEVFWNESTNFSQVSCNLK